MNPAPATDRPAAIALPDFLQLMASHHPFSEVLGIRIEAIGHGTARAVLPENPTHQRLGGIVAGPMLMALADVALYAAVVGATGNSRAVTASLTINFLRGCPGGEVLADARLLKTGRLCAGEVLLSPRGGDPVAQVVSTWACPPGEMTRARPPRHDGSRREP
ncbi:PaaI family thioesterase [Achromobacter aloeverae]|uniref:Thioesterase n=1 Tax=Achromobacter aloeverae TaxID=1750518 RepID=A0A4Q1HIU0_9BURK|nr:PaaI family thioesterase [Achromobacter aloeverae]RXN88162.1 thioesterase [Achromobacter aloeverae]